MRVFATDLSSLMTWMGLLLGGIDRLQYCKGVLVLNLNPVNI